VLTIDKPAAYEPARRYRVYDAPQGVTDASALADGRRVRKVYFPKKSNQKGATS